MESEVDVARMVMRVRRLADLSQRDLAARVGLSPSTIARIETGQGAVSVGLFGRLLAVAGLRLLVCAADEDPGAEREPARQGAGSRGSNPDADPHWRPGSKPGPGSGPGSEPGRGERVWPVPADGVRDNGGRRFPAHLDVDPPDEVPALRRLMPRYDRPPAKGWYRHRPERDRRRAREGTPADHPTAAELRARQARRRENERRLRAMLAAAAPPAPECTCLDGCHEVAACLPRCPCQCEPDPHRRE
ncbi:helix-turn-helix domain-containing protein [Terracoccus luteus]|uniref:HTH-type transcriptional regulator/antitoxin HipB n=1 Tax=Terracoccus luteus TaxID=53356 RepID=A0A839PT19_9MICO|nr:helix-turn-helix transcriptional regulator [Terracoccus luteus]MBB2985136.1 HTH-type transcriptional regulator/antitoxin HipB [Terracoccus luteus]MCP2170788.1 HTH-type transcriptional regulator/antitoxin HipB [Terracoccus luteus]